MRRPRSWTSATAVPCCNSTSEALTDLRTPSPHPLGPAALGGLQSPGGFLTGACPSTPPRFMQFEAEDEIRMGNVACTTLAQGMPPPAPTKLAPQEPTSCKRGTQSVNHLPPGHQGTGKRGLGMVTFPRWVLFPQGDIGVSTRIAPKGVSVTPFPLCGVDLVHLEPHHPPPSLRGPCEICLTSVLVGRPLIIRCSTRSHT